MKNLILRFGLYATVITVGIPLVLFFVLGKESEMNFGLAEILGYSTILLAMIFVFFGIKKYRDENRDGKISFWEGLKVGLLIVSIPAIAFGFYNLLYIEVLDPDFLENYYEYSMDEAKASMEVADFEVYKAKMETEKANFENPFLQFFLMFLTVFIIGFIASVISSMILKRENTLAPNRGGTGT